MTTKNWILRPLTENDYERCKSYTERADAEKAAKQRVASNHQDYGIYELVAVANNPTPNIEVVAVSA